MFIDDKGQFTTFTCFRRLFMQMMEYTDGTFREVLGLRWVSCMAAMEMLGLAM